MQLAVSQKGTGDCRKISKIHSNILCDISLASKMYSAENIGGFGSGGIEKRNASKKCRGKNPYNRISWIFNKKQI